MQKHLIPRVATKLLLPLILLFALVSSVGQAAFHPADYALLGGASGEGSAGKSYALHSFAGSLGFAAAPVVVGGIALLSNWRVALVVVGSVGLVYALLSYLLLHEVGKPETDDATDEATQEAGERVERVSLRDPTLLALFLFVFVTVFGSIGIQTFTPVLVVDGFHLGEATGSTALTAFFVAFAGAVLVGGLVADRFRPHVVILVGVVASAVLTWVVAAGAVPAAPAAVLVVFALIGGASGLYLPARDRMIRAATPRGSTDRSFGFVLTGISVAGVLAPALLGAVIDATSVWAAYWVVGAVIATGAVVALAVAAGGLGRASEAADAT